MLSLSAERVTTGGCNVDVTTNVTIEVEEPDALVAVSVYVTVPVAEGVNEVDIPVTVPIAGLMLRLVAPVTAQVSVTGEPTTTVGADAVKLVIVGALDAVTVTTTDFVTGPAALLAVRVYVTGPVAAGVTFTDVPVTGPTC
jgi:hypothetical protein